MSTTEVEVRAKNMGWMPKDRFIAEGRPEADWLPAEDYVKKGESIMPILKASNRKMNDSLVQVQNENSQLKQQLADAQEAIEGLKEFRSTLTKEKAQEQKKELTKAIVQARKDGDVDAEVELEEKLDEVKATIKEAEEPPKKKETKPTTQTPQLSEEAKQWMKDNPWFGTDSRKTGFAQGLRDEWVKQNKQVGTREFFDFMDQEMGKMFDENAGRRQNQKVGEGKGGGGDGERDGGGKTYSDLPADAKAACEAMTKKLVGPNKAYKTKAEWQAAYVAEYDWS